ncbi:MAG: hypothetical protein ALAOOOJD_03027 [bacterium]|nr:hypothetical protein [bacterium]
MRRDLLKITILALMPLAVAGWSQPRQPCIILRVLDQAHVELQSGATIRLAGVKAVMNLSFHRFPINSLLDSLIISQPLELEFDENLPDSCGYLWRDSLLINLELLRRGWMQVWDDTAHFRYRDIFLAAENAARGNKIDALATFVDSVKVVSDDTVYVTKSGKKYHRAHCRLLSQNKIALPLSQARIDYGPCRLCASAAMAPKESLSLQPQGKTISLQCLAKTRNGDRCKREVVTGSKYCWQHRPK